MVKRVIRTVRRAANSDEGMRDVPIIYIHGIGNQAPPAELKREWDFALFGRDMGERTRMAYWADILHGGPERTARLLRTSEASRAPNERTIDIDDALFAAGVEATEDARELAYGLLRKLDVSRPALRAKVLPLPGFLRKPIARAFLKFLIRDTAAYFFRAEIRQKIQARFRALLKPGEKSFIVVAHSQGTIISLEVLNALGKDAKFTVEKYITIGSPLGVREVQDFLADDLTVPPCVTSWNNFADPLDPVALDRGISNDFDPGGFIIDEVVVNTHSRRLNGFNPHSAVGYLAHPSVRTVVQTAARIDKQARFLVARDLATRFAIEDRHPVLIEILEPQYPAVGEKRDETRTMEAKHEKGQPTLANRVEKIVTRLKEIVPESEREKAHIDPLRRFVAAHLTPHELNMVAHEHRELRVYAMWRSNKKRKLIHRSGRVVQADAARTSYGALGKDIRWAVLDTGARTDHPHFAKHGTIEAVWDCTKPGKSPQRLPKDNDSDGHGSHVAGIIAGEGVGPNNEVMSGVAPLAKLEIYKVLNDAGEGEDAWIIKALDHIAERNENSSEIQIHGLNLSLGGTYDSTVYGCGYTPICVELRRLWRNGVMVVIAGGNEGQIEVTTPDGELELNSAMSIGDPANLEDCVAVGSVNADRPHLYGVSAFSSHGPTSDGRVKPDVVAPGERIMSCNSHFKTGTTTHYIEESGTSMAAPHVSGLLAAFLSVRREFRGRPDEVKQILLRTCIDIGRDRYHQGHGIPNLMRMLLEA